MWKSSGLAKNNRTAINIIKDKFVFPERFKGTFLERWSDYWKSLYLDYKSMVVDVKVDMQERPKKALVILSGLVAAVQMAKHNPDEMDFREQLRRYSNQVILVGEQCRNRNTVEFYKRLEDYANQGLLRKTNLGICSVLWTDDYSEDCDLFKATCEYTQPKYLSLPFRIVDVGMIGRWWNIYIKYQDFDVDS